MLQQRQYQEAVDHFTQSIQLDQDNAKTYKKYIQPKKEKTEFIDYSKYIADSLDNTITYSEYLAENLNNHNNTQSSSLISTGITHINDMWFPNE